MFSKIYKLFKVIISGNVSFKIQKKKKILIWDTNLSDCFFEYFKKNKSIILYARAEEINLYILFKAFLTFKFSIQKYYEVFIEQVKPKVVVTFTDNNELFYKLKKKYGRTKIFIQNAWRTADNDPKLEIKKKIKNFSVDYMLVFNDQIGKKYSNFIEGKYKSIGSFKSNLFPLKKNTKKKYDLVFISTYREKPFIKYIDGKYDVNSIQIELAKLLINFSKKNKMNFFIYGKNNTSEKIFFESSLGKKNWKYLCKSQNFSNDYNKSKKTYNFIDECKLIVSTDSTLGYEALQRNLKVVFFDLKSKNKMLKTRRFGWPLRLKKEGFFWTQKLNQNHLNKILLRVLRSKKNDWLKIAEFYSKKLIPYDKGNSIFVKILRNKKVI